MRRRQVTNEVLAELREYVNGKGKAEVVEATMANGFYTSAYLKGCLEELEAALFIQDLSQCQVFVLRFLLQEIGE